EPLEVALALGRHRDDDPRRTLSKEYQVCAAAVIFQRDSGADGPRAGDAALGERHGEPALGAVVRPPHEPGSNGGAAGLVNPAPPRAPPPPSSGEGRPPPPTLPPREPKKTAGPRGPRAWAPSAGFRPPPASTPCGRGVSASSMSPAMPMTGVGRIACPWVSL